jgi:hypothetical protein
MGKLIFTTLLAIFLLASQAGLQAAGGQDFQNGKPFDHVNTRIDELEKRILALEESDPPGSSDLVFSDSYTQNLPPTGESRQAWAVFTNSAIGSFKSIEIRNSFDGGVTVDASAICADMDKVNQIAGALNTSGSISLECGNLTWRVSACSGTELYAGSSARTCNCDDQSAIAIRPLSTNENWGGVGSEYGGSGGGTCGAPSQTLQVVLER